MASYLHRTATTAYPCCVPTLGDSAGAGRVGLAIMQRYNLNLFGTIRNACVTSYNKAVFTRSILSLMSSFKLFCGLLPLLILACQDEVKPSSLFTLKMEPKASSYQFGDAVQISLKNKKNLPVDAVTYRLDGQSLGDGSKQIILQPERLGSKILEAEIISGKDTVLLKKKIKVLAANPPVIYTYEVVATYPHDMKAYTQGLEFDGDILYESTGKKGKSSLRKVDYRSGEVLERIDLDRTYFGEGLTLWEDNIIQLTWQSGQGFIYAKDPLRQSGSFQYGASKEGWGLCHDDEKIFKSDGTEKIWFLDPKTLSEMGYLEIVTNTSIFNKANELEYVDGIIYANVWQKESMMLINARTGAIEGVVNFAGLKSKVKQHPELDVFNGIAYHKERQTFFVTGKNWDTLFEVRIKAREK